MCELVNAVLQRGDEKRDWVEKISSFVFIVGYPVKMDRVTIFFKVNPTKKDLPADINKTFFKVVMVR